MAVSLTELLFSTYRRQVLGLLLLRPDEQFHVREIARQTGVSPGTLHRELRQLADAGLLLRDAVGNQVRYRANRECPIFEELAGIFRKTTGLADVLRTNLRQLGNRIEIAFIFGSVAQGKEQAGSDIDLFIIGEVSFTDAVQALAADQESLGREINPVVMTRAQVAKKIAASDRFITRILDEPKIFLTGGKDDLGELAGDRQAQTARNRQG
jgi:predicted nucleotidyltransferase